MTNDCELGSPPTDSALMWEDEDEENEEEAAGVASDAHEMSD